MLLNLKFRINWKWAKLEEVTSAKHGSARFRLIYKPNTIGRVLSFISQLEIHIWLKLFSILSTTATHSFSKYRKTINEIWFVIVFSKMNEDLQKIYQPKAEGLGFHLICCFSVGYCICETLHRVASGYESIFLLCTEKIDIGTRVLEG